MVQAHVILNYTFEDKCVEFQKCCLGGKITTQADIDSRLDTADDNFFNSCWKCYMKGHKMSGKCDTDGCPVKYAHRRVVKTLLDISDALQEIPDLDLPYIKASDYSLEYILDEYNEFIKNEYEHFQNNTSKWLGQIKNT